MNETPPKLYSRPFFFMLFFFLSLICYPGYTNIALCSDQHCITRFEHGRVNWSTGTVSACGKAAPLKKDHSSQPDTIAGAAKADAVKNLIHILKRIELNRQSVAAYLSANDRLLAGIEKTAADAVVARQHYTSDGAMEIVIETSIFGGYLQLALPDEIRQIPHITPIESKAAPEADQKINKTIIHTGLVVDARELDFTPVLYPVIISENGDEIYGSLFISREFAVQYGVCKYLCSMEKAVTDKRVGNNPLVLKGLRKGGDKNACIVLKNSDAHKIEKAAERHAFLKKCRVIIVLD